MAGLRLGPSWRAVIMHEFDDYVVIWGMLPVQLVHNMFFFAMNCLCLCFNSKVRRHICGLHLCGCQALDMALC